MKDTPYFIVDAFISNNLGSGNPAAICILDNKCCEKKMQRIASEFNFSETAFVDLNNGSPYSLSFFKPTHEVHICGHATLATAHTLFEKYYPSLSTLTFKTKFGLIKVLKEKEGLTLHLQAQKLEPIQTPHELAQWLGLEPHSCYIGKDRFIACVDSYDTIQKFTYISSETKNLKKTIVIITAKTGLDSYCYRYFTPFESRIEDPATGTAQMFLAPLWSEKLKKSTLSSLQLSKRTGTFKTTVENNIVCIQGRCNIFSNGHIY